MLHKYLNPRNDVAFKKIFGTEKNKDILIRFLNDMITFKEKGHIVSVTFLKTSQDPEIAIKKTSLVDILCEDEKGNKYIVEMQVANTGGFEKRAQYYAAKAYGSQVNVGEQYENLREIIFLAISNFVLFPDKADYKSDHVILDKKSHENDLKDFSFTFLELPKFNIDINHLSNMIEKWAYFFKHAEASSPNEKERLVGHDEVLDKAYKQLDSFAWNEEELRTYEQAEKRERDYVASMAFKRDEGKKIGLAEGKEIGFVEGKEIGLIEGKEIGRVEGVTKGKSEEKFNTARNMLKKNYDPLNIAEITGLSVEQIKEIAAEAEESLVPG